MTTTQLFVASTLYGVMNLAAAIDAGQFGGLDRDQRTELGVERVRRVLLISNNAQLPEIAPSAAEMEGFDLLAKRFDRVMAYNEVIEPFHPSTWSPRPIDTPIWQRYLRQLWDLGDDDIHLVVESIQVNPAQAICRMFPDARIDVYADGLMSYGPTRDAIDPLIALRIERLLHADLVPGLRPMLLSEWDHVRPTPIPTDSIKRVIAEISAAAAERLSDLWDENEPVAILLGQYLSALGILTAEEEEQLHRQMLIGAIIRGHRRVIFKPHPNAPRELADSLRAEAVRRGVHLLVLHDATLAETLFNRLRVEAVFGCFSTAMITAATFYRVPVHRVGTELMLERLSPYENSNRIPVTIVDALIPPTAGLSGPESTADVASLTDLVTAVSYAMQPKLQAARRQDAVDFLEHHYADHARYFKRQRLTKLDLPGQLPPRVRRLAAVRRRVGRLVPTRRLRTLRNRRLIRSSDRL